MSLFQGHYLDPDIRDWTFSRCSSKWSLSSLIIVLYKEPSDNQVAIRFSSKNIKSVSSEVDSEFEPFTFETIMNLLIHRRVVYVTRTTRTLYFFRKLVDDHVIREIRCKGSYEPMWEQIGKNYRFQYKCLIIM